MFKQFCDLLISPTAMTVAKPHDVDFILYIQLIIHELDI